MGAETKGPRRPVARPSRAAVILGNDALIAARPSTSAQLASACVLAGFDIILPPSAGDEIVASAYLDRISQCSNRVVLACACPHVQSAIRETPASEQLACIAIASPPVAAARYLRALHGDDVLITFVGNCPGAADPAIDARFSPAGFLASLHRQGIAIEEQPDLDRHGIAWGRHVSTPGGFPARRYVARPPVDRVVREIRRDDLGAPDIATGRTPVVLELIDASCACSAQREESADLEPVRSAVALFAVPQHLDLTADNSLPRSRPSLRTKDGLTGDVSPPAQVPKKASDSATDGASPLPARRDSKRTPERQPLIDEPAPAPLSNPSLPPALPNAPPIHEPPRAEVDRSGTRAARAAQVRATRRSPWLIGLPVVVLAVAAALGAVVYAAASNGEPGGAAAIDPIRSAHTDSGESISGVDSLRSASDSARVLRSTTPSVDSVSGADSLRRDSTRAAVDSVRPRRPRRARPTDVIPGWMPQGQPTWTPDSQPRRPDTLGVLQRDR